MKKQITIIRAEHSIKLQQLQKKIEMLQNLTEKKTDQLKQIRREISQGKTQILRLKDVIDELKSNNFISADDEKFLNV